MPENSDKDFTKQSTSGLEWGEPDQGMGHYGAHKPVIVDGSVVCLECGAEAENRDPEAWP